MPPKSIALIVALSAVAAHADGVPSAPGASEDPNQVLRRVSAEARTIPKQATALALLAWPDEGRSDPALAAAARDRLVRFGHNGLPALRAVLGRVDPLLSADVTAALIEARWRVSAGDPPDYLPGLVDALWFGSAEAQRLAMIEVSRFQFAAAAAPIIDAVQAHPELTPVAIAAFERTRETRGRFFLLSVVVDGPDRYRAAAAEALAAIGDQGLDLLRESARGDQPAARRAAMGALLPTSRPEDLTALYEYLDRFGTEDPALAEGIRSRAVELESDLEQGLGAPEDEGGS